MKYLITLYVCSFISGVCDQIGVVNREFDTYHECVKHGYRSAYNYFNTLDKETVEVEKQAIRFECKHILVEKPSNLATD